MVISFFGGVEDDLHGGSALDGRTSLIYRDGWENLSIFSFGLGYRIEISFDDHGMNQKNRPYLKTPSRSTKRSMLTGNTARYQSWWCGRITTVNSYIRMTECFKNQNT